MWRRLFRKRAQAAPARSGRWVIEVQHPDGPVLFAAHAEGPGEAEELVARLLEIDIRDAWVKFPCQPGLFEDLAPGEIRGPM